MTHRRLTIVQALPALDGGGVERGTVEIAEELVRNGHRSIVISSGGRMLDEITASGSEHIQWPIGRKSLLTFRLVGRLRRLLENEAIDVLHARSRLPAWIAWLAWRRMAPATRPHFLTTVHGLYSVGRYSEIMTRGERLIAVSDTVKRYILDNYPAVEPQQLCVIPRGVDRAAFPYGYQPDTAWSDAWYRQHPQLTGRKTLILPGRITRLKGHHDFITLIGELIRAGRDVHGLVVGGEDPHRRAYADELRERIDSEGLGQRITFLGHRDDIREIYASSNVVLSLSTKPESFGRTVLEALSLGVPVIGYDHGGVGEVLAKVYPSGRVPVGDGVALKQSVEQTLASPVSVPPDHPFSLRRMLDATLNLYREVAGA